jgi:4'-phosphopantetheinyl transferase
MIRGTFSVINQNIYVKKLNLIRPNESFDAGLCLCEFSMITNYEEIVCFLHQDEQKYYETLKFERRIKSYLLGRLAAKNAIASMVGDYHTAKILIHAGIFNQPIATLEDKKNIQVSISHCDDFGAAIAFPEAHPMGIDIEKINIEQNEVIERETTESEIKLIKNLPFSYAKMLTFLWTVKEALSKVLKTGLMTPFKIYEIDKIEIQHDYMLCFYKNFAQYKAISFTIGDYVCSITYPIKTDLNIDILSINKTFKYLKQTKDINYGAK